MEHLHLALAHLPVVGFPLAVTGWALAWRRGDAFWEKLFGALWLLLVLVAGAVYFSGGRTFEELRLASEASGGRWPLQDAAETHAVAGRAALMLMLLSAVALGQGWLAAAQGAASSRASRWAALGLGSAALLLLPLTAWLGGKVGHP